MLAACYLPQPPLTEVGGHLLPSYSILSGMKFLEHFRLVAQIYGEGKFSAGAHSARRVTRLVAVQQRLYAHRRQ